MGLLHSAHLMGARLHLEEEIVDEIDDLAQTSTESFDRIAFAERAVALVRPPGTTVAICQGARRVRIASGRQWGAPEGHRWAMLSVPHDASRLAIAKAVLELGAPSAANARMARPFALDVLIQSSSSDS